jgi:hypothetical protein
MSFSHLKLLGASTIQAAGASSVQGSTSPEFSPADLQLASLDESTHTGQQANPPSTPPNPTGNGLANENPGFSSFEGLTHFDTRTARGGNQFSTEPPDQGLCVGNGFVLEAINDVVAVYNAESHARLSGPTALSSFFNLPPDILRTRPLVFGQRSTDPKCYFDASTNRWFVTMLKEDVNPQTGALSGPHQVLLAVSQTGNPSGSWTIFSLDVTDDGTSGTPTHAHCPCLGDQPLIGADANGFYISTNEFAVFPFPGAFFNGAQVYAISKQRLEAAAASSSSLPTVVQFDVGALATPDKGGIWGSLQPATSPKLGDEPNKGTEYLLASLDFFSTLDNRLAVWALTNTRSLDSETPQLQLSHVVIESEVYGQPPDALQKPGSTPLADFIAAHGDPTQPLEKLAGNDDRMNQVVFANGLLWGGVNTIVQAEQGAARVGAAYFLVQPGWKEGHLIASVARQGYVALDGESVLFPSIGVNAEGRGVIGFSISGPDFFPSAAYALIDAAHGAGKVHIGGAGVGPEDGFTGYNSPTVVGFPGNGTARWGDYSAAVAAPDGSIWLANEYIAQTCTDAQFNANTTCGGTRTSLANWATFVSHVDVSAGF